MIQPGERAPDVPFALGDVGSGKISDYLGRPLVLYFYPKDDTSGCTREALDFTALAGEFADAGVQLLGVSRDSLDSHRKFAAKHGLKVTLASDEDGALCEAFGVWVEKNLYGRKYMGIERATFLIDADGKVAKVWRKVKVAGHAEAVLAAAKALGD
ncbi:peroxiredoxin [Sphingomonas flavalba]|uniref:peroxiredoxin n=1 Tax=Sphingomonas flavalba TaxID=2559804 RepID=UPI00109DD403|nr:peroxiredoxin [Sphingomonas flavalba]